MIIKQQFKIDLIQLKHTSDPEGLLNAYKAAAAIEMGKELVKSFPFVKNEEISYQGSIPEVSMNREHEFMDLYESEFVALTMKDFETLSNALSQLSFVNPRLKYLHELLNPYIK